MHNLINRDLREYCVMSALQFSAPIVFGSCAEKQVKEEHMDTTHMTIAVPIVFGSCAEKQVKEEHTDTTHMMIAVRLWGSTHQGITRM